MHIEINPKSKAPRIKRRKLAWDRRKSRNFRFPPMVDKYINSEAKRIHVEYTEFVATCILLSGCKVKPGMKFKISLLED